MLTPHFTYNSCQSQASFQYRKWRLAGWSNKNCMIFIFSRTINMVCGFKSKTYYHIRVIRHGYFCLKHSQAAPRVWSLIERRASNVTNRTNFTTLRVKTNRNVAPFSKSSQHQTPRLSNTVWRLWRRSTAVNISYLRFWIQRLVYTFLNFLQDRTPRPGTTWKNRT